MHREVERTYTKRPRRSERINASKRARHVVGEVGPVIIQWRSKNLARSNNYMMIEPTAQQTQTICITFTQCRPNVEDVGPTLYKCYTNVLCLLGGHCPDVQLVANPLNFDAGQSTSIGLIVGYSIS